MIPPQIRAMCREERLRSMPPELLDAFREDPVIERILHGWIVHNEGTREEAITKVLVFVLGEYKTAKRKELEQMFPGFIRSSL